MPELSLPTIHTRETTGMNTVYEIAPLQSDYSVTIGHTLHQIMGHFPGTAITALRIGGTAPGEQEIAGVEEVVQDLILNIKQVRLRCLKEHPF